MVQLAAALDAFGQQVYFITNGFPRRGGYSLLGHISELWRGDETALRGATYANLRGAEVYIIASPDNADKNPHPHYANAEDAAQIASG